MAMCNISRVRHRVEPNKNVLVVQLWDIKAENGRDM